MPFNGAGVYSPPSPPIFPAIPGELIKASDFNFVVNDIAAALTNCVTKDNQSTTAALTVGTLTATAGATLPAGTTVGGVQALTRRYATGEIVLSINTTAPAGTVALNGTSIGSALSGATGRADSDTQALFELLWNQADNTLLPIQDATGAASVRGASAAADFAANKRMPLPAPQDGDALLLAVSSGVLTRSAGEVISHGHTATVTDPGHSHPTDNRLCLGFGGVGFDGGGLYANDLSPRNGTYGASTGISVSNALTGGTKNKAAGFYLRPYIAL